MLTVTRLARTCGLSRSTLLYYESIGLLKPAARTTARYRSYGDRDIRRLQQICLYRDAGLKLQDIRAILDRPDSDAASVPRRRLTELAEEIETLRGRQRSIVKLLRNSTSLRRTRIVSKEKWASIMKASGFTDADMHRWHKEFERAAPDDHQQFLEFLHIPGREIDSIREWSRASDAI